MREVVNDVNNETPAIEPVSNNPELQPKAKPRPKPTAPAKPGKKSMAKAGKAPSAKVGKVLPAETDKGLKPTPGEAPQRKASKPKPDHPMPARQASATSMNRRMRLVEGKRTAILEAALAIFSRFGLHGTSLDQVASMADVSKTNLLYYFSSKEELYISVLRQLLEVWLLPLRGFSVEQDPIQAISDYIRVKLELSRDHPAESRLFCLEIIQGAPLLFSELEQPLRTIVEAKVAVIQAWIDAGKLAPIEPHHLIFSLWATTQHYADFRTQIDAVTGKTLSDPLFFNEVLENIQALILNGIRPRA